MESIIVQRLKKKEDSPYKKAERYYMILSAVNGLHFTEREIQLLAYTAIKGNISYANNRREFCEIYKTSGPTINNIISKLKKINVLVRDGKTVKVNNVITLDFTKDISLEIKLLNNG